MQSIVADYSDKSVNLLCKFRNIKISWIFFINLSQTSYNFTNIAVVETSNAAQDVDASKGFFAPSIGQRQGSQRIRSAQSQGSALAALRKRQHGQSQNTIRLNSEGLSHSLPKIFASCKHSSKKARKRFRLPKILNSLRRFPV